MAWPAWPSPGLRKHPWRPPQRRGAATWPQASLALLCAPPAQYHALGLLYHVRKNDRLAVSKMISKFTRHGLKSPFAYCMMIRVASRQLEDEDGR